MEKKYKQEVVPEVQAIKGRNLSRFMRTYYSEHIQGQMAAFTTTSTITRSTP